MRGLTSRSAAYHYGPTAGAEHYVYRCYDADGDLIYIGCTANVDRRMSAHRRGGKAASRWLSVCMTRHLVSGPYPDREAGRSAEAAAIAIEQPVFNVQERRIPGRLARIDVARYLVERGHIDLARETACVCLSDDDVEVLGEDARAESCIAHRQEIAA